jgi:hypothetical protein
VEVLFEVLFEIFGELLIQLIGSGLGLVAEHAVQPYRRSRPRSPAASIVSHVLIGAALGGLSLLFLRHSLVHGELGRIATLFGVPLVAGAISAGIGALLKRSGRDIVPLERFGYAYLFAFSISAVRFLATM